MCRGGTKAGRRAAGYRAPAAGVPLQYVMGVTQVVVVKVVMMRELMPLASSIPFSFQVPRNASEAPATAAIHPRRMRGGSQREWLHSGTGSQTPRHGGLPRMGIRQGQRVSRPGRASHWRCRDHVGPAIPGDQECFYTPLFPVERTAITRPIEIMPIFQLPSPGQHLIR